MKRVNFAVLLAHPPFDFCYPIPAFWLNAAGHSYAPDYGVLALLAHRACPCPASTLPAAVPRHGDRVLLGCLQPMKHPWASDTSWSTMEMRDHKLGNAADAHRYCWSARPLLLSYLSLTSSRQL